MRTFIALRKAAANYKEIMQIVTEMKNQNESRFIEIYRALDKLINPPPEPRKRIGFKPDDL
jgi:hypothetical protein